MQEQGCSVHLHRPGEEPAEELHIPAGEAGSASRAHAHGSPCGGGGTPRTCRRSGQKVPPEDRVLPPNKTCNARVPVRPASSPVQPAAPRPHAQGRRAPGWHCPAGSAWLRVKNLRCLQSAHSGPPPKATEGAHSGPSSGKFPVNVKKKLGSPTDSPGPQDARREHALALRLLPGQTASLRFQKSTERRGPEPWRPGGRPGLATRGRPPPCKSAGVEGGASGGPAHPLFCRTRCRSLGLGSLSFSEEEVGGLGAAPRSAQQCLPLQRWAALVTAASWLVGDAGCVCPGGTRPLARRLHWPQSVGTRFHIAFPRTCAGSTPVLLPPLSWEGPPPTRRPVLLT